MAFDPATRARLIEEARARIAEIDRNERPDRLGGGRIAMLLRALIEEIDERAQK
jgi:hypothetical protein